MKFYQLKKKKSKEFSLLGTLRIGDINTPLDNR
jgi:hypothetical protein